MIWKYFKLIVNFLHVDEKPLSVQVELQEFTISNWSLEESEI
jgi:hypothetical protein